MLKLYTSKQEGRGEEESDEGYRKFMEPQQPHSIPSTENLHIPWKPILNHFSILHSSVNCQSALALVISNSNPHQFSFIFFQNTSLSSSCFLSFYTFKFVCTCWFSRVKLPLLLPGTCFDAPTAEAKVSDDISQLPLLIPQLERLWCEILRPSMPSGGRILLKSAVTWSADPPSLSTLSSLLVLPSLPSASRTASPQASFLPISMSLTGFLMFGLVNPPLILLEVIAGSLGIFALKLFLDVGILVQNTSMKFFITPLLYGLTRSSYRFLKFS